MAFTSTPTDFSPSSIKKLDPAKYTSLSDYINEVNKPDNRDALVKTYGNQGITGFLQMVGATKSSGSADEVQYWEETRLHAKAVGSTSASGVWTSGTNDVLRPNDVILIPASGIRAIAVPSATTSGSLDLVDLATNDTVNSLTSSSFPIVGNLFAQGSDQQTSYLESNVVKRTNPYMIIKDIFKVTGSQATNIGWINLGNGDYRWYVKGEQDTRQRFMDKREMMMLLGQKFLEDNDPNTAGIQAAVTDISGSEGYFSAIENRGMVHTGLIDTLGELDLIVKQFDKQGAGSEYALYVNRDQDLAIDDMLASANLLGSTAVHADGLTGAGSAAYGAFNNSAETAISLGFKSFSRGGYTFHKHDWKLLNDPTLLGDSVFKGVAIPMSTVVDPQSGDRNPSLEMNFKNTNGYSREMEHWITGSFMGATNDTKDVAQFNYRSEMCLVTRAANRHMLIK